MDIPFEAYRGSEPYMFVSYAHKDNQVIYAEIKRLHTAGYRIWYDEGIPAMTKWAEAIAKAIKGCEIFLVFLSPQAVASENVKDEIHLALEEKKPILGVHLEQHELPPELQLRLTRIQMIMKYQLSGTRYYRMLTRELPVSLMSTPPSPESASSEPSSTPSQKPITVLKSKILGGTSEPKCTICRRGIYKNEEVLVCPSCGGVAHPAHIKEWLKVKSTCPKCKQRLRVEQLTTGIFTA